MSHNTWIHKLSRVTIVNPLAKTRVHPNHLTLVRLVTGLGAVAGFATGAVPWVQIGAVAFLVSMLFDRADGDLARVTGRTSPMGHKLDLIADSLCNSLIFVGLGMGLSQGAYGAGAIIMGVTAGAAVAAILGMVIRVEAREGARAAELGGAAGFDPDDAMALVPLAVLFGAAEGLLLAAAIGAPCFAVFFLMLFRRKLFGEP
ncbi:MAG: CDP-alcohol phosphatidyltransferase family protein [Rhodospirillaceae bacterium]|jgi:archaetidylinositol phosphate synthase|nr:CDP-alcohol phosphatidyltransferase family protein [Rhodospirillaceae bacterium]